MQPGHLEAALDLWTGLEKGEATLLNLSENHTFRIDTPEGGRAVLRVHRPHYHARRAIESELAWMQALRAEAGLFTPRPIPGRDGRLVQQAPFAEPDDSRFMVLFAFEEGDEPQEDDDLAPIFVQLGELAARCHRHVERWTPPEGFERPVWDAQAILAADGIWGNWRAAPHVAGATRDTLDALEGRLCADLAAYGTASDRFGLVHADMRLANLLVSDGITRLIDFDDSGFCWFGYDFAAAVSFFEDSPQVPRLRAAWLEGYRALRPFSAEDEQRLDALVMLRRMALLAWVESHKETPLAQACAPDFARGTAEMAWRFLETGSIDR